MVATRPLFFWVLSQILAFAILKLPVPHLSWGSHHIGGYSLILPLSNFRYLTLLLVAITLWFRNALLTFAFALQQYCKSKLVGPFGSSFFSSAALCWQTNHSADVPSHRFNWSGSSQTLLEVSSRSCSTGHVTQGVFQRSRVDHHRKLIFLPSMLYALR